MGDVLNLQASIGRGGRYGGDEYQLENIWKGIRLANHIAKQGSNLSLQAKEDMDKVKARAFTEISAIKAEVQYTISLVKKIDHFQRWLVESLDSEVGTLKIGMIDAPRLDQWSEDMDS